ncbi:MAG: tetratricopeptide repeat protein [Longimicrobiales bacterium]
MAGPKAEGLAFLPWADRPSPAPPSASPRSAHDVAILRALAERIPQRDAGAHNNLGVVYYQKGLAAEAAEQFELALDLDPHMHVAERNLQIVYFGFGYFDQRLRELRERLDSDPHDVDARRALARTFLYGGDAVAAIRELLQARNANPRDPSILRQLARAEIRRGEMDAALLTLRDAVAAAPNDAVNFVRIGELMYQRGFNEEARDALEQAIARDDTMAEAHHYLAFVCGELGDADRASQFAAKATALNPSYARAEKSLSLERYSVTRYEELLGERAPRPVAGEGGTLVHFSLGLALRQKGLFEEAAREFRLAMERGEDPFLVGQAEAEMALLAARAPGAVVQYRELIEQEPASPKLWNELGTAWHQQGELDPAAEAYLHAIELDGSYVLAWNNLGVVRHHRGEAAAAEAFHHALAGERAAAEVWRNLGWHWHRRRVPEAAEHAYRQALDTDDRLASAWTGLGMLFMEAGRTGEAKAALARAVEADPALAEARYHYGFALSATGEYQAALRETSRALELNPYITTPRFRLLIDLQFEDASVPAPDLGAVVRVAGDEGIESFEFEASALDAVLRGPVAHAREVDDEPANPAALPSKPASFEWLAAARAAVQDGQFAEAQSAVQQAASLGANRIETQLLQAEIFLACGAAGEAVERYGAVVADLESVGDASSAGLDALDIERRAVAGLTRCYLDLDRPEQAVEAGTRYAALLSDGSAAAPLLAEALDAAGDPMQAVQVLAEAVAKRPDDVDLLTRLGSAHAQAGDHATGEALLRRAAERSSAPAAHVALAHVLRATGRGADAEKEYRTALAVIPSLGDAAFGLADLEFERGNVQEAIHVLVGFLEVDPYNLSGLVQLGDMLWLSSRQAEASIAYRRVLSFDPGHTEAREGLERLVPMDTAAPAHRIEPWPAQV